MSPLTVAQLARVLFGAADILRGRMDASQYRDVVSGMLVLKRASDQPGVLRVPERARWSHIVGYQGKALGHVLNDALWELERSNPEVLKGVFEALDFDRRLGRAELKALVDHFDHILLSDDNLEFGDEVGRAYDLILSEFADSAGKRGGEFFTPRSVVRLMVRLVRPQEGQSVYDPFAGSGGMLVQARQYVDEHDGDGADLALFGQEVNGATWSTARLNLLLHSITDGSVLCGDTLTDPLHSVEDGRLRRFDRVLTNPPFSMKYSEKEVRHPERMKYGGASGQLKNADLMNVQHVLATLRPDGIGAVVTPHGVLFRGGAEREIRRGIVEDARLEAVIGIGPNVFHGTSLPACILVLRGANGTPADQRGQVLFINAEREVVTGRSQNRLEPQNIEKIVSVFREWMEIPGFSRAVSLQEIAENDFNLNIRRYVDASPPAEPPLDVRATLFGGVPRSEVETEVAKFHSYGIGLADLFTLKSADYLDFLSGGCEATAARLPGLAAAREEEFIDSCRSWWEEAASRIAELAESERLLMLRPRLMASFREELLPAEILDRYQLAGAFAAWWSNRQDDLRSLDLRGFPGVIDRWATADGRQSSYLPQNMARERVLDVLGEDLRSRVEKLVVAERQGLVNVYRSWGDRYETSLMDLERQSEAAAARLGARLKELGYT
ncbi:type I restriction-modification system subunit M [Streptomyces sp. NBC_00305]|uniref:type I restriction-modification system subunit M n=1 Tax=Streptomyces sp. NBC_01768 TaxID=2975938 RepID=UPI002DD9A0EF|nr:class I SAM-dependent DNA methyltransferase [Streptomyces sp. NBC_01768]MCX5161549.1 type I restriction-modification system subunit M [Streptomyces sp. NBC_00305]WSC28955.1 type I restriction-modification system subunit M [Streptomyces sp. NBC_01768]